MELSLRKYLLIFSLLASLLITIFILSYFHLKEEAHTKAVNYIQESSELRKKIIENWRKERLADGRTIQANTLMIDELISIINDEKNPKFKNQFVSWINTVVKEYDYSTAYLYNGDLSRLIFQSDTTGVKPDQDNEVFEGLRERLDVHFSNIHLDKNSGRVFIELTIPLLDSKSKKPFAYIFLQVDPAQSLLPGLVWSGPEESGEVVLGKTIGDSVLLFSNLKSIKHIQKPQIISGLNERILIVKGLKGIQGVHEGLDYNLNEVLGGIIPIEDTNWVLVTKIDLDEIYANVNREGLFFIIIILLMIGGMITFIIILNSRTNKKLLQEQLKNEQEKNKLLSQIEELVANANDAILTLSEDGKIIHANERAQDLYGYSFEEIRQLHVADLYKSPDNSNIQTRMNQIKEYDGLIFETIHVNKEGNEFPVEISTKFIKLNGTGCFESIIRDITERKQWEKQIKNLSRLYAILSQVNEIIVRSRSESTLFQEICNVVAQVGQFKVVWIGLLKDEIVEVAARSGELSHKIENLKIDLEIDKNTNGPTIRAYREEKGVFTYLDENMRESNQSIKELWDLGVRSGASVLIKRFGEVVGNLTIYAGDENAFKYDEEGLIEEIGSDISFAVEKYEIERKQTTLAEELKENLRKYENLIENLPGAVFRCRNDADWTMEFLSQGFAGLSGYETEDILFNKQISYNDLILEEDRAVVWEEVQKSIKAREIFVLYYRIRKKDGEIIYVYERGNAIYDDQGNLIALEGVLTDITDRIEVEHELRTAKEKAEEMNRLKSNFLANMSHELRTPMMGIMGYAEILFGELADNELKSIAELLLSSSARLHETLNSILDLSKIESETVELNVTPVKLNDLLKEVLEHFRLKSDSKGIELKFESNREHLNITSDERMLASIFMNLVSNAIKFTSEGSITVSTDLKGNDFIVEVTDTGIGIKPEYIGIIFDPFRQISEGLARSYEGTGLGLAIAKKYTQLLGGSMTVSSKYGKGTTFTVKLKSLIPKIEIKKKIESSGKPKKLKHKPEILLVEDDDTSAEVEKIMLQDEYNVTRAESAEQGLELANRKQFDVILMDISLRGELNGLEAVAHLRNMNEYKSIPIIAVTALAMSGDRERFLNSGCTDYLAKPFTKKELLNVIKRATGN